MEAISTLITSSLSNVSPVLQLFFVGVFSFAEGLPIIGSILPGGTIAIFAGTLAEKGLLNPIITSIVIGFSSFFGDMTGFLIGKKFKHKKWIRNIVHNEKHKKAWDLFDRHIAIITIFGKLIPVVRSTPSLFAAVRDIKTKKYITYSFIGSIIWAVAGVYAGKISTRFFGDAVISILISIILLSIVIMLVRSSVKHIKRKSALRENL